MALIVEDGSGVPNANSYIDVAAARSYASARGKALPSDDSEVETLLTSAMDFIESYRADFQGRKSYPDAELQWPRDGVRVDGFSLPSDAIPRVLVSAQAQLAIEAMSQDLMPSGTGREVVTEKVDVVEMHYAATGNPNPRPVFTKVEALLRPLFRTGSAKLVSVRV